MRKSSRPLLLVALVFAASGRGVTLAGQDAAVPSAVPLVASAFKKGVEDAGIVGGSLLVVKGGQVLTHETAGYQDLDRKTATSPATIYHWASITKTFTGIAIMQLRDRGLLTLDTPAVTYIPELRRVHNPFGDISQVTIRTLMQHAAGFRASTWPWGGDKPWHPYEPTSWEQLAAMLPYTELLFAPGTEYRYSNPGIIFLGRIIEALSGEDFEVYVTKNILMPLGMHRTFFDRAPYHLLPDRSHSYLRTDGKLTEARFDFDTGITVSNGGLNAPLTDMALYLQFLMGEPKRPALRRGTQTLVARADVAANPGGQGRRRRQRRQREDRAVVLRGALRRGDTHRPQRRPERLHLTSLPAPSVAHGLGGELQHRRHDKGRGTKQDAAGRR